MGHPAKIDDPEVDELRQRLAALPIDRQARVLESVLTPGLRLRVLAEQVRGQVGPLSDAAEEHAEREIGDAVKEVRRSTRVALARALQASAPRQTTYSVDLIRGARLRGRR